MFWRIREGLWFARIQDFKFVTFTVCNPRFGILIKGHIPWFRDPKPWVETLRYKGNINPKSM